MTLVRFKKDMEQLEFSYIVSKSIKSYIHLGKLWAASSKVKQILIYLMSQFFHFHYTHHRNEYVHNSFSKVLIIITVSN